MPKTYYLDDAILNAALRGIPFTPPAAVYMALYTIAPGFAGGGVEVSGGSYLRQLATFSVPLMGQVVSTIDVLFPIATADWGNVTSFALLDASLGGNMLYFASLRAARFIEIADQVRFRSGQLICQET